MNKLKFSFLGLCGAFIHLSSCGENVPNYSNLIPLKTLDTTYYESRIIDFEDAYTKEQVAKGKLFVDSVFSEKWLMTVDSLRPNLLWISKDDSIIQSSLPENILFLCDLKDSINIRTDETRHYSYNAETGDTSFISYKYQDWFYGYSHDTVLQLDSDSEYPNRDDFGFQFRCKHGNIRIAVQYTNGDGLLYHDVRLFFEMDSMIVKKTCKFQLDPVL